MTIIKQSSNYNTLNVLTIQSPDLKIVGREYAKIKCNYSNALPVYKRLFSDYNKKFNTHYESFFWGFSELLVNNLNDAVKRASEMIGFNFLNENITEKVYLLKVPRDICLETDFYNFSDEIFSSEFPDELKSNWESIYTDRISERQVIFPYIDESMIINIYKLSDFLQPNKSFNKSKIFEK